MPDGGPAIKDRNAKERPRVTLYRWWTDGCPHCHASLPAIDALRQRYEHDGLRVVGVYHPKPPRAVDDAAIRAAAESHGYHGDIAVDEDWSILREAYLRWAEREATSISLLVDERGIIRFVHPGPDVFPSAEAENAVADGDFNLLEDAVRGVLQRRAGSP